jgi:hypothetical protein
MTDAAALPGQPRGGVLSGPATARAVNVLAPNPSAMTLDGTNTWILSNRTPTLRSWSTPARWTTDTCGT